MAGLNVPNITAEQAALSIEKTVATHNIKTGVATQKLLYTNGWSQSGNTNKMMEQIISVPKRAVSFRIGFISYEDAFTIEACHACTLPTFKDINSHNGSWTTVRFNYATTADVPAGFDFNGNQVNDVPSVVMSDQAYRTTTDRTDDVAKDELLYIRATFGDAYAPFIASPYNGTILDTFIANNGYQSSHRSVDKATNTILGTWGAAFSSTTNAGFIGFIEWVTADSKSISLCAFGDSLIAANTPDGSGNLTGSWVDRLQNESRIADDGFIPSSSNFGSGGQLYNASCMTAKNVIAASKPTVACFYGFSPNSGYSTLDRQFGSFVNLVAFCVENGTTPVPITSGVTNSATAQQAADLRAHNQKIRDFCNDKGLFFLDFETIINDPLDPDKINPLYALADGIHYNSACYEALTAYAYPALKSRFFV